MDQINKSSSVPLYQQLYEKLKDEINEGTYPAGSRLPTEAELSETYQVSRVTVRKAMEQLEKEDFLVRKVGKGTFVRERKFSRQLSAVMGFSEMCRSMGFTPGSKTIKIALEDPSPKDTQRLGLDPEEKILVIDRIRYADGMPVVLETTKFAEDFFFLFDEDLNNRSLYEVIRQKKGIEFTNSVKHLEVVFANYQESRYLGISVGYPLLKISSVVNDSTGEHRYISIQRCVADKFEIVI
jgi:GntR family transcriptional regulator